MHTHREVLVQSVLENIYAMKRGMHGHLQAINRSFPIPQAQFELLLAIRQTQPVSFKALAQQLYLTPGAVSQLVEGLEAHNLVNRHVHEQDRRMQHLQLSKQGAKMLLDAEKLRRTVVEKLMHSLSDKELETWLHIQQKLLAEFQTDTI